MDKTTFSKKILTVSVMPDWGGGEEFLFRLIKTLKEFDFLFVSPEGAVINKFRENGLKTKTVKSLKKVYRASGWSIISLFKIIFGVKVSTIRLLKTYRDENPSIILANGLFAALYVLPSIMLSKRKLIIVQHLIFNERRMENKVVKLAHKQAEKIICVSNTVRENVLLMLNRSNSDKIIVIPNGIILPGQKEFKQQGSNSVNIGFVGSIIRIKGIHLIIEALKEIKGKKFLFHIFGTVADNDDSRKYKDELEKLIELYDLKPKVIFHGYIESKERIYSSLNIVVNFSLIQEALSYTILEAMAFKKIVIAANEGGPKEIIEDGETGFLVEPQNIKSLNQKILYCIEGINTSEFKEIRDNAFKTVSEKYSIEKFAESYRNLFNSLIRK